MSEFKLSIDDDELKREINSMSGKRDRILRVASEGMVGDIKQSMLDSPATGRIYEKSGGRSHTASSPGNPPRVDIGALVNSIRWRAMGQNTTRIEDGVEYGIALEFGFERTAERPFMRPVFSGWAANKFEQVVRRIFGNG